MKYISLQLQLQLQLPLTLPQPLLPFEEKGYCQMKYHYEIGVINAFARKI